jgi:hypothetical protein
MPRKNILNVWFSTVAEAKKLISHNAFYVVTSYKDNTSRFHIYATGLSARHMVLLADQLLVEDEGRSVSRVLVKISGKLYFVNKLHGKSIKDLQKEFWSCEKTDDCEEKHVEQ